MNKDKRIITILSIFTIIFTLMGGTLAYWTWTSDTANKTGIAFTIDKDFSCSADGGQNINSTNIQLQPTSDCTNSDYALQRTIKVTSDIKRDNLTINLDMWLTVNSIGTPLSESDNFMYAISTTLGSCKKEMDGYVTGGNFKGLTAGSKVNLLKDKIYSETTTDTYYLYIWLDSEESNNNTQNQSFNFSLGGECSDNLTPEPEAPVLDSAMIPVKIDNNGKVTTVSSNDPSWYDYENKEWANVVLVEDQTRRNYYLSNLSNNVEVTQSDIVEYYVWIPRYKYRIPEVKCGDIVGVNPNDNRDCYKSIYTAINETTVYNKVNDYVDPMIMCDGASECTSDQIQNIIDELFDDGVYVYGNWVSGFENTLYIYDVLAEGTDYNIIYEFKPEVTPIGVPVSFDIVFEKKDDPKELGNATTEYRTHPAFYGGTNKNLSGIWVGKFELTNLDVVNDNVLIVNLPNRSNSVDPYSGEIMGGQYGENYPIVGLNSDYFVRHEMTNSEWGAVAYLSHSDYGINEEVRINNTYITGCGAASNNQEMDDSGACTIPYGSGVSSYPQSTTGNITGVFDMSGGNYGEVTIDGVLSSEAYFDDVDYMEYLRLSCSDEFCYGHAIKETQNWYMDAADNDGGESFFTLTLSRGGGAASGSSAGVFAYFVGAAPYSCGYPIGFCERTTIVEK